jgi:metal-responsive CopG/Arc/MetJ family transcriptional regulator
MEKIKEILLDYELLCREIFALPSLLQMLLRYLNRFEEEYQKAEKELDELLQQSIALRRSETLQQALKQLISCSGYGSWKQRIQQNFREFFEEKEDTSAQVKEACTTIQITKNQLRNYQMFMGERKASLETLHKEYVIIEQNLIQLNKTYTNDELSRKTALIGELIQMQVQSFTIMNLILADNQKILSELESTLKITQPLLQNASNAKALQKADYKKLLQISQQLKDF